MRFHLFVAILAALIASFAHAEDLNLRAYEATFAGRFSGAKIEIEARLLPGTAPGEYVFRRWSEPRGLARLIRRDGVLECARFELSNSNVLAIEHHYIDGEPGEGKSTVTKFDDGNIATRYRGESVVLSSTKAVDRMSEEIKVTPQLQHAENFDVEIVERNDLHTVHYTYVGEESIKTKLGTLSTRVFERRRGNSSRTTKLWVAPAYDYLAVRLERLKNGKSQGRAEIQSIRWLDDQALGNVTPVCP